MKHFFTILVFVSLVAPQFSVAEMRLPETYPAEAFQNVMPIPSVDVLVPTVVEVALGSEYMNGGQPLVYEKETDTYIGSYVLPLLKPDTSLQISTIPTVGSGKLLTDSRLDTYLNFPVSETEENQVRVKVDTNGVITTSRLDVTLAQYVALPLTVEIYAAEAASPKLQTMVAKKKMTSTTVTFPEVTANHFEIVFTYAQPLRISELHFSQMRENSTDRRLRFLAQPGRSYEVLLNPDRVVKVSLTESGNLRLDDGVLPLSYHPVITNIRYSPADTDDDGVKDIFDNCVQVQNSDQIDVDHNGRGDACDDFDRDGRINSVDNCINQPNRNQSDEDGDGIGDVCDEEESRFTEKNPWVPWVGMGTAIAVLIVLFMLVARGASDE